MESNLAVTYLKPIPPILQQRLAPHKTGEHRHQKGYIRISAGRFRGKYLHRLIWDFTHPDNPVSALEDIHHKDGDPTNFHPDNLEKIWHWQHPSKTREAIEARKQREAKETPF